MGAFPLSLGLGPAGAPSCAIHAGMDCSYLGTGPSASEHAIKEERRGEGTISPTNVTPTSHSQGPSQPHFATVNVSGITYSGNAHNKSIGKGVC